MEMIKLNGNSENQLNVTKTRFITDFLSEIRKYDVLTPDKEKELIIKYKETGDKNIRNYILSTHQRFIYSAAKRYTTDPDLVMELVSEANIDFIEAIEKYDPSCENRLMAYAQSYIRRGMNRCLYERKMIQRDADRKIGTLLNRERDLFFNENCRYPTNDELRYIMGEKYNMEDINDSDMEMTVYSSLTDVNSSAGEDAEVIYEDSDEFVNATMSYNDYEGNIENDGNRELINNALDYLDDRERQVINMLFGIGYDFPVDPDDVAAKLGLTRTRVLQIKNDALDKMRVAI